MVETLTPCTSHRFCRPTTPPAPPPWDGQLREDDYRVDHLDGAVPPGLRGALYRIGPGRFSVGARPIEHIFDGDGMVSRFQIDDDGIGFRNRFVRTETFVQSIRTGRMPRGFGTRRAGGALANALRFPQNMANTNLLLHGRSAYALWEGGRPHRLDPETLATFGPESFGGALKRLGAFSAHPKTDPRTGEVFNFGLDFFPRPLIRCYRLDAAGRLHSVAAVPISRLGFVHDFALTATHLVFVLGPLVIGDVLPVLTGRAPFDQALSYRPELGTEIVLVPRDGGRPVRIEHDALFHFHVTNAYDRGDEIVVELVAHHPVDGWRGWNAHLHDYRGAPGPAFGGTLTRLIVDPQRRTAVAEELSDRGCEFPQTDPRRATGAHRYTYVAEASAPGGDPDTITTIDHRTGARSAHRCDGDGTVCEPVFAADPDSDREGPVGC